jgi:hypothetical protein
LNPKSKNCRLQAKEKLQRAGYNLLTAFVIGREVARTTAGLLLLHLLFPKKIMPERFETQQNRAKANQRARGCW